MRLPSSQWIPTKLTSSPTSYYSTPASVSIPLQFFLEITFNRTCSFSKHVSSLKATFFHHLKTLHCFSSSSWGPTKDSLSFLYKAFLWPLLTYASPRWFPFSSNSNITELERLHQAPSPTNYGCLSSSPIPLLLFEGSLSLL